MADLLPRNRRNLRFPSMPHTLRGGVPARKSQSCARKAPSVPPQPQSNAVSPTETAERHAELPGNTVCCELPGPFALVSEDATDGGDMTARHRWPASARVMPVPWRGREHAEGPGAVRLAVRRSGRQDLRPASRRDLGLPRARRRHHAGGRAAAPAGVARARLVSVAMTGDPRRGS